MELGVECNGWEWENQGDSWIVFFCLFLQFLLLLIQFALKLAANLETARFDKEAWKNITQFKWALFQDEDLRRKFKLHSVLGDAALPEDQFSEVHNIRQ